MFYNFFLYGGSNLVSRNKCSHSQYKARQSVYGKHEQMVLAKQIVLIDECGEGGESSAESGDEHKFPLCRQMT